MSVAHGAVAPTDPQAWAIIDGKLYLNANKIVRGRWEMDIPGHITGGDAHWPKVLSE